MLNLDTNYKKLTHANNQYPYSRYSPNQLISINKIKTEQKPIQEREERKIKSTRDRGGIGNGRRGGALEVQRRGEASEGAAEGGEGQEPPAAGPHRVDVSSAYQGRTILLAHLLRNHVFLMLPAKRAWAFPNHVLKYPFMGQRPGNV